MEIKWTAKPRIEKDGDYFIAHYDKLELESFGKTKKEVFENLTNAIESYCHSLSDKGLLQKRLDEKGIKFTNQTVYI